MSKIAVIDIAIVILTILVSIALVKILPDSIIDLIGKPNLGCLNQLPKVSDEVYRIKTRNSELLGKQHEVTGIEFIEKEVVDAHGKRLIGSLIVV